jgi:dihydroxyacetone kinase-like protein
MLLRDIFIEAGEEVAILISGLGNTMLMEQHILFRRIHNRLMEKGISIYWSAVGNYFTSLDMMGATVTVMRLDDELKGLLDVSADSVALAVGT